MSDVSLREILTYTNDVLEVDRFTDYCPNGLQVEGKSSVRKLISGVTASLALIEAALQQQADAILVHHGYFWRNESAVIVGMKRSRIEQLLNAGISLLAYHLPLDAHPLYGNNAQLAARLGWTVDGSFGLSQPQLGMYGHLPKEMSALELGHLIEKQLHRTPLHLEGGPSQIKTIAWCSGAAQDYFSSAIDLGVDAYVTGEVSEWCVHMARERHAHFFAAGHHATERYGVQALGDHLADHFGITHQFIEIPNPV